jgi:hypothetical protein
LRRKPSSPVAFENADQDTRSLIEALDVVDDVALGRVRRTDSVSRRHRHEREFGTRFNCALCPSPSQFCPSVVEPQQS